MRSKEGKVRSNSDYYVYQPSTTASKIYLYPVALGCFYYEPGYYLRRNSYDSFLIMYIRQGTCTIRLSGQTYVAQKDQIVFLDCYQPHEYGNMEQDILEIEWIHFDGILARNYYDLICAAKSPVFTLENTYQMTHNLEKLLKSFRTAAPAKEATMSEALTQMLTTMLPIHQTQAGEKKSLDYVIENAMSYINEHFSEPLSLEMLAKHAHLSPYYFSRIFTAKTGFSPHQYLIATRLNSAKFLLQTPDMSIKEIAYLSGFSSESAFCSTFRKWEKVTPGEFRERSQWK